MKRYSLALVSACLLIIGCAMPANAQDEPKPQPAKEEAAPEKAPKAKKLAKTKSPEYIDFGDVLPPKVSFQYWLDTINTTDAEFEKLLIEEFADFNRAAKDPIAKAKERVAEIKKQDLGLRKERIRRLKSSFDYDAAMDLFEEKERGGEKLSSADRRKKIRSHIDKQLGRVTRETYIKRNIVAVKEWGAPDYATGKAKILIRLRNLSLKNPKAHTAKNGEKVDEFKTETYVVYMNLFAKGLMWRWFDSKRLPFKDKDGKLVKDPFAESNAAGINPDGDKIDPVEGLKKRLAVLQKELAKTQAMKVEQPAKINALYKDIQDVQEAIEEIARRRSPYGTPDLTWRTTKKAIEKGDWDTFVASHTKEIREKLSKDKEAKKRFENVYKARLIRQQKKTIIMDPDDQDKATVKVTLEVSNKLKKAWTDQGKDIDAKDIDRDRTDKKVLAVKMVREGGKWLINLGF